MTVFWALSMGLTIGLSLGALGGGGSILTVPALVYVLGEPARTATTESLIVVGSTSLVAAIAHARARHVRWGPGLVFGLAGLAASYAGTAANRHVDPNVLMLAFAGLIMVAAIAMLRCALTPGACRPAPTQSAGAGGRYPASSAGAENAMKILVAGSAVGFLTGFLGVGGGFVIVPVLTMALGYEMADAVGTSLLVISINSTAALLARTGQAHLHLSVLVPFTAAALAGALTGHRITDRLPATTLKKAFAALLVLVGCYVALRAATALAT